MKVKIKMRRGSGITRFRITGDKGDELAYGDAELLQSGSVASFVPLAFERRGKCVRLTYAADGFIPLMQVAAEPFVPYQLPTMLVSVLGLLRDCESTSLLRQRISMEPEHVLYNALTGELRFIYVPLQSYVAVSSGLPGILVYLCERARVPNEECALRDAVLSYARKAALITSTQFERLLEEHGVATARFASSAAYIEEAESDSAWLDTDQLGSRVQHGRDFVSEQLMASAPPANGQWALTRDATGESWILTDGVFEMGSSSACGICPSGVVGLSRRHLRITVSQGGCWLCDLASTNGVYANGGLLPVQQDVPISRGTQLRLGTETFRLG